MIETILSNLDGLRLALTPSEKEHFVAVITEQLNLIYNERDEYRNNWIIAVRQNERLDEDIAKLQARLKELEAEISNWQDCYCEFETIAPDGKLKISVLDIYNRIAELNARIAELEAENAALKAEPKPLAYWSDEKKQTYADNEGRSAKGARNE